MLAPYHFRYGMTPADYTQSEDGQGVDNVREVSQDCLKFRSDVVDSVLESQILIAGLSSNDITLHRKEPK